MQVVNEVCHSGAIGSTLYENLSNVVDKLQRIFKSSGITIVTVVENLSSSKLFVKYFNRNDFLLSLSQELVRVS